MTSLHDALLIAACGTLAICAMALWWAEANRGANHPSPRREQLRSRRTATRRFADAGRGLSADLRELASLARGMRELELDVVRQMVRDGAHAVRARARDVARHRPTLMHKPRTSRTRAA